MLSAIASDDSFFSSMRAEFFFYSLNLLFSLIKHRVINFVSSLFRVNQFQKVRRDQFPTELVLNYG